MNSPFDPTPSGRWAQPEDPDERHRIVREQLGAYALDQLAGGERLAVAEHLDGCASCREELAALLPLAGPLAVLDPDDVGVHTEPDADSPDPDGFAAIRARVRAEAAAADGPPVTGGQLADEGDGGVVPLRPRRRLRSALLGVAAAVVLLAAGAGVGLLVAPDPDGPVEDVAVQALSPGIAASAGVVPHTWGVEVKLTATGFTPGATYRATVLDDTGRPVAAGEFIGTGGTEMTCNLNSSVLRDEATGFTVTDAAGRPVLTSTLA